MTAFTFEIALAVENYLDEQDPDDFSAFEDAASDLDGARLEAREEMAGYLTEDELKQVTITSVVFIEHDSANPYTAGAMYEVHADAPDELIGKLSELVGTLED